MAKWILFLVMTGAWLGSAPAAQACSCADSGPFLTVAEKSAWAPGVLIVRAEVRGHEAHGMEVKVLEVLSGREEKSTIRVWGDPGWFCRLYTHGFKTGEGLVLILNRINNAYFEEERNGDYELSGCGSFVVREDKSITGRITGSDTEMSRNKFFDELEKILDKNRPDMARIGPNPVMDNVLTVNVPALPQPTISGQIITIAGQLLQSRQFEAGKPNPVDVSTLAPGIYIILFRSEHQYYTRRFVKQ